MTLFIFCFKISFYQLSRRCVPWVLEDPLWHAFVRMEVPFRKPAMPSLTFISNQAFSNGGGHFFLVDAWIGTKADKIEWLLDQS